MDEEILSLKWNNHNSTFIHTLSSLHKVEMYSDVTIACEGKYFPVHKLVLSVCSEYFEEILSKTKCQHPVIVLKDIKHSDLEALLNYMYAGEANVTQSELANLIKAAECLRIKGLAVPDEATPVRDKRRHSELSESSHNNKKRRSEDIAKIDNETLKDIDSSSESSQLNISDKNKRLQDENQSNLDLSENHKERIISNNYKNIPEIVLEGEPIEVKQEVTEPKIEEQDDSQPQLEESTIGLSYTVMGNEENNESDRHSQESHLIPELMTHSIPGPSGVQGHESITNWENNANNLSGYSVDNYSSDENRSQQMGDASSSTFMSGNEFLGSDLLLSPSLGSGKGAGPNLGSVASSSSQPHHQCHCCPKRFLTRQDLRRHLRTHTGERPFKCTFCNYRAALKGNVKKHIISVHKTNIPGDGLTVESSQLVFLDLRDSLDNIWDK